MVGEGWLKGWETLVVRQPLGDLTFAQYLLLLSVCVWMCSSPSFLAMFQA